MLGGFAYLVADWGCKIFVDLTEGVQLGVDNRSHVLGVHIDRLEAVSSKHPRGFRSLDKI
jgi:hypothetical protein